MISYGKSTNYKVEDLIYNYNLSIDHGKVCP